MNRLIQQAFTLIELLVVIAIIGILSGLIIVSMGGITTSANIAKAQVFSNSLRNALMMNLVSEWKFEGNANDSWNGGNNGTWGGAGGGTNTSANYRPSSECVSGQCLNFDGTDDYVEVSNSNVSTSNLAITGAMTLSAWAKFGPAGTNGAIMGRGYVWTGSGDCGYFLSRYSVNNYIYFDTYNAAGSRDYLASSAITDSNWHYIVATWDGTVNANGKKIYIDSALNSQGTSTISAIGQPAYNFRIGRNGNGNFPFAGSLDEIRIFNAPMPTSQIKAQYYAGLNNLLAKNQITPDDYINRINESIAKK